MQVARLFEILARSTWRTIDTSHRTGFAMGEDAITASNMNAIAAAHLGVLEETRAPVTARGCHFEFWIGSELRGWSRYALVARRIARTSSTYANLTRKIGGRPEIDALEEYARANRAAPLYCFYNSGESQTGWNCNLLPETEQLGCSITPLDVVRRSLAVRGGRSFAWIHGQPETIPWRCLVRCPMLAGPDVQISHSGWPERAAYHHERLPASLRRLQSPCPAPLQGDASDRYGSTSTLRPAWVAVFDLERR